MRVNGGPPPPSWADGNPLVDLYQCRDGRWVVRASLCQTGMWFQRLGPTCDPAQASGPGDTRSLTAESDTAWGRLTYLMPCVEMSETPTVWSRPPVPLGTHPAAWPD